MKQVISDFFQLGALRVISRILTSVRGLVIVTSLTPHSLGEYTIWLLFVFYFSIFDFGILSGLERDLPHYRGKEDREKLERLANIGWSSFFVFSAAAACFLGIVTLIVFQDRLLAVLLAVYLFVDKFYRAYYTNSRIHLQYRDGGVGELLISAFSLLLIWFLLPRYKAYGIFTGFILATIIGMFFLYKRCPIKYRWLFNFKDAYVYIKSIVILAIIVYSIDIFHMVPMTVLAFLWDKETLGYFAFAFKFFQIFVSLFPFLIQEVMRTRIYYFVAQLEKGESGLQKFLFPMTMYGFITACFWLGVYWWVYWGVRLLAPAYIDSAQAVHWLCLALLPLGITKICSDYLCSPSYNMTPYVVKSWFFSIFIQAVFLVAFNATKEDILFRVPIVYLFSSLLIYVLLVGRACKIKRYPAEGALKLFYLLCPILAVFTAAYGMKYIFAMQPTGHFMENVFPFIITLGVSLVLISAFYFIYRNYFSHLDIFTKLAKSTTARN